VDLSPIQEGIACLGHEEYDRHVGRRIAIVRSAAGLSAVTIAREPAGFTVSRAPFAGAPLASWPERDRLLAAWEALGAVTRLDAGTLADLLAVLLGTVPAVVGPSPLPAPELAGEPPPPRATAAHPRAYRGTKHKPPRPAKPGAIDLRPHLDDPRHLGLILRALAPTFREAAPRLAALDVDDGASRLIERAVAAGRDPGLAAHTLHTRALPIRFERSSCRRARARPPLRWSTRWRLIA
jgi:hypothetical protein